jgi:hypothetical protein
MTSRLAKFHMVRLLASTWIFTHALFPGLFLQLQIYSSWDESKAQNSVVSRYADVLDLVLLPDFACF